MSYCQGCADKQAALDALTAERDRWKAAYGEVYQERDRLLADKQRLREALRREHFAVEQAIERAERKSLYGECPENWQYAYDNAALALKETA